MVSICSSGKMVFRFGLVFVFFFLVTVALCPSPISAYPKRVGTFWTTVRNASNAASVASASVVYRPTLVVDRSPSSKVAGGTNATKGQFSYLVAIVLSFGGGSEALCGGSIISERFILTAAHCLYGMEEATIVVGQNSKITLPIGNNSATNAIIITIGPPNVILHPGYDPVDILNDIALILLPVVLPLRTSSTIKTIRLPSWNNAYADITGYDSIVSGWGAQSSEEFVEPTDEASQIILRYATSTIVPNEACRMVYGSLIRDQQVCVSGEGGRNPCQGDSGGPLTVKFGRQGITQVGIVSYGSVKGCEKGVPGVYTRVSSYIEWIVHHAGIAVN